MSDLQDEDAVHKDELNVDKDRENKVKHRRIKELYAVQNQVLDRLRDHNQVSKKNLEVQIETQIVRNDLKNTKKDVHDRYNTFVGRNAQYRRDLDDILVDKQQQLRLNSIVDQAVLSPGGKLAFREPDHRRRSLAPDELSNPFIEKSGIITHRKKMQMIDQGRDRIQLMYQRNHKTLAQAEEESKDVREMYFENKMHESQRKLDGLQRRKKVQRTEVRQLNRTENTQIANMRSAEKVR